jgi:hypothetical protein
MPEGHSTRDRCSSASGQRVGMSIGALHLSDGFPMSYPLLDRFNNLSGMSSVETHTYI